MIPSGVCETSEPASLAPSVATLPGPAAAISRPRIEVLDVLRGLAAIAVTFYHFTTGNHDFLPDGWLKAVGHYGVYGVDVFFVISGFVIPYSLWTGGYRLQDDFRRFVVKRVSRLDPPYLVTIAIVLVLSWLTQFVPRYGVPWSGVPWSTLLLHLGYLNPFFNQDWLNPVFWTLAVEFQFYLGVGLFYPLLCRQSTFNPWLLVPLCGGLSWSLPDTRFLPFWLPLFAIGLLTFQLHVGIISRRLFGVSIAGATTVCWALIAPSNAIVGVLTALAIAFVRIHPPRLLLELGALSYSVYLMHVPFGSKVIRLGSKLPDTLPIHLGVIAAAFVVTLLASLVLYRLVELPSQRFSSSIRYAPRQRKQQSAVPPGEA